MRKWQRINEDDLQHLRNNPEIIEKEVSEVQNRVPSMMTINRTAHLCDNLIFKIDSDVNDHIILVIHSADIDPEIMINKKTYDELNNSTI